MPDVGKLLAKLPRWQEARDALSERLHLACRGSVPELEGVELDDRVRDLA